MNVNITHPTNGYPETTSLDRTGPRHRKRSSSLFALDELCLPSPPLSPSVSINFSTKDVTGEIPIVFDFLTTSSMPSEERITKMASLKPSLPPLAKFSPMSAFFPMSDSSGTLNTISTQAFGAKRPGSYYSEYSTSDSPLEVNFDLPSPIIPNHDGHGNDINSLCDSTPCVQVQEFDDGQKKLGDISNFTISTYLASPSVYGDALDSFKPKTPSGPAAEFGSVTPQKETSTGNKCAEEEQTNEGQFLTVKARGGLLGVPHGPDMDKTPTQSTFMQHRSQGSTTQIFRAEGTSIVSSLRGDDSLSLSTTDFANARGNSLAVPSPEYDDKTPTQSTFFKRHTIANGVSPSSPSQSLQLHAVDVPTLRRSCSSSDVEVQSLNFEDLLEGKGSAQIHMPREPPGTTRMAEPATLGPSELPGPTDKIPLPVPCLRHAQWLRDTTIELWIDQEGFRAIRPKFFLASISNNLPYSQDDTVLFPPDITELTEEHDPLYTTVAEFLPINRAAHYFHHAALDRAPTLNRITTCGDETRDFTTRAATLLLRDNGVFFVQGTEDHRVDDRPGLGRIVRLNWRFEYFVSSRRPDGRSAHRGEKVMTPLSFSCTPALLDRTRASKVNVLHIMKKTVLSNLIAQKLEPPDLPNLQTHASVSSLATLASVFDGEYGDSVGGVSERRSSRSILPKTCLRGRRGSTSNERTFPSWSFAPPRLKSPPREPLHYTKHRRGSHSDTTPEDFRLQKNLAASYNLHERSRSDSFNRGEASATSLTGSRRESPSNNTSGPLMGPIIPQEELFKLVDTPTQQARDARRRAHSVRIEVHDNVQVTTLPAAPRYK